MKRPGIIVLAAGLFLMALTAGALTRIQSLQKIGRPGVRVVAENIYRQDGRVAGTNSVFLPENAGGFTSKSLPLTNVELESLPRDTVFGRRLYSAADGFWVQVGAVLMGRDRSSIHKPEACLPAQGAKIGRTERLTIPISDPKQPYDLPVTRMLFSHPGGQGETARERHGVYVYWFVADGQITENHNQRMRWMARDLLTKVTLQRWAYLSCYTECVAGGEEAAYARMAGLIAAAVPQFQLARGPAAPAGK
jgi:hypothetical protein